jgi:hypothetical protein
MGPRIVATTRSVAARMPPGGAADTQGFMNVDDKKTRGRLGWVTDLFAQVFSTREIIPPGQYCAYNAFAGIILLGAAFLIGIGSGSGSGSVGIAVALGVTGLVMISGVPGALFRAGTVPRLLVFQGSLFVLLAFAYTVDSVKWAFLAPRFSPFRYAPGLALVLLTYGGLQVAGFGRWTGTRRRFRVACLIAGVLCELLIGSALLLRALRP